MSDEIKEIINQLEIVARKHTIKVCEDGSKIETMPASVIDELRLNNFSAKVLLDYITNLQTIEREYSSLLSENAELQQENDRLNNIINELEDMIVVKLQRDYHEHDYRITTEDLEEIYDRLKELKENNNAKD